MRVVFLNPTGAVGGAERVLLNLIASLRSTDPTLNLSLIAGAEGPLLEGASEAGADCQVLELPDEIRSFGDSGLASSSSAGPGFAWRLGRAGAAAVAYAVRLRRALARLRPDIVHSNGVKFHALSGMRWVSGVPTVWHVHDFLSQRRLAGTVLGAARGSKVSALAVSRAVEKDCRAVFRNIDVTTVYNAVDTKRFSPRSGAVADLDAIAGRGSRNGTPCRVGLVATYARWKGQDVFLRAAARVLESDPSRSVHFYVVGGPIYETEGSQFSERELVDLSASLGLRHRVSFIPFQRDTAPVYRALDVVVHASTQPEPFGMTVVESMACGRATVISNAGGAAELFSHGADGWAVRPSNPEDLSEAIIKLADDPEMRSRLGRNARETAVRRFHLGRLGPEVLTLYRSRVGQVTG